MITGVLYYSKEMETFATGLKRIKLLSEDNKLNQKQIAVKTGMSVASVQRAMKRMVEQGKVVRVGGKRFGYWKVE